jgi:hypothetical protein
MGIKPLADRRIKDFHSPNVVTVKSCGRACDDCMTSDNDNMSNNSGTNVQKLSRSRILTALTVESQECSLNWDTFRMAGYHIVMRKNDG